MFQALEFLYKLPRCFLDLQVWGPLNSSTVARSGHALRIGLGSFATMMHSQSWAWLLLPGNSVHRCPSHQEGAVPCTMNCTLLNLLSLPTPCGFCFACHHIAPGILWQPTWLICHSLRTSAPSLLIYKLFPFVSMSQSRSYLCPIELSLSHSLLCGLLPSPVCVKPSLVYFITFPRYHSAKSILLLRHPLWCIAGLILEKYTVFLLMNVLLMCIPGIV